MVESVNPTQDPRHLPVNKRIKALLPTLEALHPDINTIYTEILSTLKNLYAEKLICGYGSNIDHREDYVEFIVTYTLPDNGEYGCVRLKIIPLLTHVRTLGDPKLTNFIQELL